MGTEGWKDKLLAIEESLAEIEAGRDSAADSAVYSNLMTQLYLILLSKECIRYFVAIYKATGAREVLLAKDPEDYMCDLLMEVRDRYDPSKGHLLSFLTARLKNRIIDDARKSGGIVGLPREWEKRKEILVISADETNDPDKGTGKGLDIPDQRAAGVEYTDSADIFNENLIMDAQLHELASQILHFMELHPGKKGREQRYLYYKLFYSTDIINYLKIQRDTNVFRHERDTIAAMHIGYTFFCTDKKDYRNYLNGLTVKTILHSNLAMNEDALPEDRITKENREERLMIPLQNEVVRGYLERKENKKVSPANISQMKKKYMVDMYESLRKRELSYASIVML